MYVDYQLPPSSVCIMCIGAFTKPLWSIYIPKYIRKWFSECMISQVADVSKSLIYYKQNILLMYIHFLFNE